MKVVTLSNLTDLTLSIADKLNICRVCLAPYIIGAALYGLALWVEPLILLLVVVSSELLLEVD